MDSRSFLRITLPLAAVNAVTQAARTAMSTVGPMLAVQYGFSAAALGSFSAVMFCSYCLAQIPAGIAMDRWGPRRVQAGLCLLAACGFALFASASSVTGFVVGRLLTGVGVAAGLIGMLKGNSEWLPKDDVARATGLGMVVGTLGSFLMTAPAQAVMPVIGWRGVIGCCSGAALAVALWNLLSVPELALRTRQSSLREDVGELRSITRSDAFRRFAPIAALLTVLNFTYLGLWAGPWLRDVAHLEGQSRGNVLLLYTVGLFLGGPLTGCLVSRTQPLGWHPMVVPIACTIGLITVQIALALMPTHVISVAGLWLTFAFLSACGPVAYAAVSSAFPSRQAGRVSTAVNTLTLALVLAMQVIIGVLVDQWPHAAHGNWDPRGYSAGLVVTIVLQIAAVIYAISGLRGDVRFGIGRA